VWFKIPLNNKKLLIKRQESDKEAPTEMEEACFPGFSGGSAQGKLGTALLGHSNPYQQSLSRSIQNTKEAESILNLHISIGMKKKISLFCLIVVVCGIAICFPIGTSAEESPERFTLQSAIETALEANLDLKISEEEIQAAQSLEKAQRTTFYPKFSASYSYRRNDSEERSLFFGVTQPLNLFALSAQVTQPIFTGFALLNQYKIASLGLDIAKIRETIIRREIIFGAKNYYFLLLKAEKLLNVSEDAVKQLEAHRSVAENFYQVGMTPLNDLLKAEVELANAHQDLVVAQNNLEIAKANFNTLLRRPINGNVELEDILDFASFEYDIDYCLDMAEENRFEIQVAALEVEVAEKKWRFRKKTFTLL